MRWPAQSPVRTEEPVTGAGLSFSSSGLKTKIDGRPLRKGPAGAGVPTAFAGGTRYPVGDPWFPRLYIGGALWEGYG